MEFNAEFFDKFERNFLELIENNEAAFEAFLLNEEAKPKHKTQVKIEIKNIVEGTITDMNIGQNLIFDCDDNTPLIINGRQEYYENKLQISESKDDNYLEVRGNGVLSIQESPTKSPKAQIKITSEPILNLGIYLLSDYEFVFKVSSKELTILDSKNHNTYAITVELDNLKINDTYTKVIKIGRSQECHIYIESKNVSKVHALISYECIGSDQNGYWVITDNNSSNSLWRYLHTFVTIDDENGHNNSKSDTLNIASTTPICFLGVVFDISLLTHYE